jgi:hypothetical protein
MIGEDRSGVEGVGQMVNGAGAVYARNAMVLELASLRDLLRTREHEPPERNAPRVLPGTWIAVHRVAALVKPVANGRLDLSQAEAAFPELTRDQILTAFRHSRACPCRAPDYPAGRLETGIDRMERMLASD